MKHLSSIVILPCALLLPVSAFAVDYQNMSFDELLRLANAGDTQAQYRMGKFCELGCIECDGYTDAARWYRLAAEKGHAEAQFELGTCYSNGYGVENDYDEAAKWWYKAAEQNNLDAQCSLALYYYYGMGDEANIDYNKAAKWLLKAAESGDSLSQYLLGRCYFNGRGVPKNSTEAKKWYRRAANQGNEEAAECLKIMGESR